jgi:folate-dependent phosphoribosylglycinamide formyltransferase PurN
MNQPIKVIILTDGQQVKKWVADIIDFVSNSPDFIVSGVVVNEGKKHSNSSLLYRGIRFLDSKFFKAKSNPFQTVTLNLDSNLIFPTTPIQKQFSDWLDDDCLAFLREKQPDLILRFGFRILRGPILSMPKYGIWSLHHGDNKVNRGGPPGFWEVVQQEPISGVTLQQITEDLDGGKVIGRAFTKTDLLSFHRNQVNLFEIGVRLFEEKLIRLSKDELIPEKQPFDFYSNPLFKNPDNKKSLGIIFQFGIRI